jgi:hypothetical protein
MRLNRDGLFCTTLLTSFFRDIRLVLASAQTVAIASSWDYTVLTPTATMSSRFTLARLVLAARYTKTIQNTN